MNISVVVPVYNSEATLPALVSSLESVLEPFAEQYEIILVNDGSRDGSWNTIVQLMKDYPKVKGICLMRNFGQHNALLCGIRACKYPITVTIDDDLQNPAFEIPRLVNKLQEGYDVVYGTPVGQKHDFVRIFLGRTAKFVLSKAIGSSVAVDIYPFRAFRTEIRNAFSSYNSPSVMVDFMLAWGASRFSSVKVSHHPRVYGKSNYSFFRLVGIALNMITGFTTLPLRFASLNGFAFMLLGICALTYVIINFLIHGHAVPGFAFISCLVIIFSGAQLLALGVIGEYLSRIYFRSLEKPPYVVREENLFDTPQTTSNEKSLSHQPEPVH